MDVDELLAGATLPDVEIDTEAALARTAGRWRARRQRRLAALAVAVVVVVASGAIAIAATSGRDAPVDVHTGTQPAPTTSTVGSGSWRRIAPSPLSPRTEGVAAWTGREVVVVGGSSTASAPLADGAAYDPAQDAWRRIADAPAPFISGSASWTGRELLVAADVEATGGTRTGLYSYDPATDHWKVLDPPLVGPLGPLPAHLSRPVWTGKQWVFVDETPASAGSVEAYDPSTAKWAGVARPIDGSVRDWAVVWAHDEMVVIATADGQGETVDHAGYLGATVDIATGRWHRLPAPRLDDAGSSWVGVGHRVVNPLVGMWDLDTRMWEPLSSSSPLSTQPPHTGFVGAVDGWAADDTVLVDPTSDELHFVEPGPKGRPSAGAWTGHEIVSLAGAYTPPPRPKAAHVLPEPPTTTPDTRPHRCAAAPGSLFDTVHEPRGPQYEEYTPWTDSEGCFIRIDDIADRPDPQCPSVRTLTISARIAHGLDYPNKSITYVRAHIDPDAMPPSTKFILDFHHGEEELWFGFGDPDSLYVRYPDHVELWPAQQPPVCE
ncbi:MAG: hypothetical protein JO291_00400 [Acidimicrobiia bacterium]|nr:hypothetical protein [Acidimicrobiia bacterium]